MRIKNTILNDSDLVEGASTRPSEWRGSGARVAYAAD
jgi:hypothetical protein